VAVLSLTEIISVARVCSVIGAPSGQSLEAPDGWPLVMIVTTSLQLRFPAATWRARVERT